jgi:hypothetical protein
MNQNIVIPQKSVVPSCQAQEIHWVNQNKEYTATSTYLLETVITDTRLSGRAAQLWQMLFSKARFDNNLSIRVSVAYLSQQMNRSIRQIQRYINSLLEHGYLIIESNHRASGAQLTNTYLVRFPEQHMEAAKAQASRAPRYQRPDQAELSEWENLLTREEGGELESWANPTKVKRSKKEQVSRRADVTPGDDINVIHNNTSNILNIKNNITNNKQTQKKEKAVVDFSSDKDKARESTQSELKVANKQHSKETSLLQTQLDKLKKRINKTYQDFHQPHKTASSQSFYDKLKELNVQESGLTLALTRLERKDNDRRLQQRLDGALLGKGNFVQSQEGNRAITGGEFRNLKRQLLELSKQREGLHVPRMLNEITYAVRFGHLTVRRSDQKPMSIRHGFNIALKLLREGAWETPVGLEHWIEDKIQKTNRNGLSQRNGVKDAICQNGYQ